MTTQQAPATRVRWLILAILFAVTTINYADRATIAIAGPELKKLLGLSPVQMGYVFSAFAWSYVLAQLPGGWLSTVSAPKSPISSVFSYGPSSPC